MKNKSSFKIWFINHIMFRTSFGCILCLKIGSVINIIKANKYSLGWEQKGLSGATDFNKKKIISEYTK